MPDRQTMGAGPHLTTGDGVNVGILFCDGRFMGWLSGNPLFFRYVCIELRPCLLDPCRYVEPHLWRTWMIRKPYAC